MKKMLSTLLLGLMVLSTSAQLPGFSAFSDGDNVYVTVLGDSCNYKTANLKVSQSCQEDRLTKNIARSCNAELFISTSKMICFDNKLVPKVITLNLDDENVAQEAAVLKLTNDGVTIRVRLKPKLKKKPTTCYDSDGYHPVTCPKKTVKKKKRKKKKTKQKSQIYTVTCSKTNSASCSK